MTSFEWNVVDIIGEESSQLKYVFMILNTPLIHPENISNLWNCANFRMAVDGGSNELHYILTERKCLKMHLPHLISGDMDSARPEVLEFFSHKRVEIVRTPDQNHVDFFKALRVAANKVDEDIGTILAYCEWRGRFDHIMCNVNVLYQAKNDPQLGRFNVFIIGDDSLTWLLQPGHHILRIPRKFWSEKFYCGLIPIGNPCFRVTTTGLKWNLDDSKLEFGGLVSGCNTYDVEQTDGIVTVDTDNFLVWSMTIRE